MEASRLDCPVCPARALDPGLAACPSCGTDLGPLLRVRELAARAAEVAVPSPSAAPAPEATGRPAPSSRLPTDAKLALGVLALWVPISVVLLVAMRGPRPASHEEDPAPPVAVEEATSQPRSEASNPEVADVTRLLGRIEGVPGATATAEGENVRIVFADGIFASGSDVATAAGLASLHSVGRALAAASTDGSSGGQGIVVDVVGSSDDRPLRPGGPWRDNWSLGLGRARAAAEILRAEVGAAPIRWRASSAGEAGAPWTNDTEADRSRNRTVVLYVARAELKKDQP